MAKTDPSGKERRHLERLETLIDSVYALVIVFAVAGLPDPITAAESYPSAWAFLREIFEEFVPVLIGMTLLVIYWTQSNAVLGCLDRTDAKHASLSIAQICLLLVYFYSIDVQRGFPEAGGVLATQSVLLVLMGVCNIVGWSMATRNRRLVADEVSDQEILDLRRELVGEPLSALITIPFAFVSAMAWNLSWLVYPVVSTIVRRRRRARAASPP